MLPQVNFTGEAQGNMEKHCSRLLRYTVENTDGNRRFREQCEAVAMGEQPRDDLLPKGKEWLGDIVYNDIWNQVSWMKGQALRRELSVLVNPRGHAKGLDGKMAATKRQWQARSILSSTRFGEKASLAFQDAAMNGQGWVGLSLVHSPDRRRLMYRARHLPWASEFPDPRCTDDDMRHANFHFSIMWEDTDVLKGMFPSTEAKNLIDENEFGAPTGREILNFSTHLGWGAYFGFPFQTITGSERYGGGYEARKGCAYGKAWFRYPAKDELTGERGVFLFAAPFILSKSGMDILFLTKPDPAWGIAREPVTNARNPVNGDPFPPLIAFTAGMDRALQYTVRAAVDSMAEQKVIVGDGAIPEDNGIPVYSRDEYNNKALAFVRNKTGVLDAKNPAAIVPYDMRPRAEAAISLAQILMKWKDDSSPVNKSLTGQSTGITSGRALREVADHAISANSRIYMTFQGTFRGAAEWALEGVKMMERHMSFGQVPGRDGRYENISEAVLNHELSPEAAERLDLGVDVVAVDKSTLLPPEGMVVLQEAIKVSGGDPTIVLNVLNEMDPGSPMVASMARTMARKGLDIPEHLLEADDVKAKEAAAEQAAMQQKEERDLAMMQTRMEIVERAAKAAKLLAETGKTAEEMDKIVVEAREATEQLQGENLNYIDQARQQAAAPGRMGAAGGGGGGGGGAPAGM